VQNYEYKKLGIKMDIYLWPLPWLWSGRASEGPWRFSFFTVTESPPPHILDG